VCLCKECGRIDQSGRDAQRSRFHLFTYEFAHLVQLGWRGRLVFKADDVLANCWSTYERSHILWDSVFLKIGEIFRKRCPLDVELHITLRFTSLLLHLIVQRAHRTLTEYLRCHTLLEFT